MEIKPQELRSGNLLMGEPFNCARVGYGDGVVAITAYGIGLIESDPEFGKKFKPIELTPEWFKRLGFTSIDGSESGHRECYSIFTFSTTGRRLPFFIGVCENGSYSPIMYHDIHEEIRYVHQLMNLFHSLTGEELAIDKTSLKN